MSVDTPYFQEYEFVASGNSDEIRSSVEIEPQELPKIEPQKIPKSRNLILLHPSTQLRVPDPAESLMQKNPMHSMEVMLEGLTHPISKLHQPEQVQKDLGRAFVEIDGKMKRDKYGKPLIIPKSDEKEFQELCQNFFSQFKIDYGKMSKGVRSPVILPLIPQVATLHQGLYGDALNTAAYNFSLNGKKMHRVICRFDALGNTLKKPIKKTLAKMDIQGKVAFAATPSLLFKRNAGVNSVEGNTPVHCIQVVDPKNPEDFQLLFKSKNGDWEMISQTAAFALGREILQKRSLAKKAKGNLDPMEGAQSPVLAFAEAYGYQPIFNLSFKAEVDTNDVTQPNQVTPGKITISIQSHTPELQYRGPGMPELSKMGIQAKGISEEIPGVTPEALSLKERFAILASEAAKVAKKIERKLGETPPLAAGKVSRPSTSAMSSKLPKPSKSKDKEIKRKQEGEERKQEVERKHDSEDTGRSKPKKS